MKPPASLRSASSEPNTVAKTGNRRPICNRRWKAVSSTGFKKPNHSKRKQNRQNLRPPRGRIAGTHCQPSPRNYPLERRRSHRSTWFSLPPDQAVSDFHLLFGIRRRSRARRSAPSCSPRRRARIAHRIPPPEVDFSRPAAYVFGISRWFARNLPSHLVNN